METPYSIKSAGYHIYVSQPAIGELLRQISPLNATSLFILTDENTALHCLPKLTALDGFPAFHSLVMPAGEQHKTLQTAEMLWSQMLEAGAGRDATLLCLGGGVVCDMGAFVASLYKRGIPFLHMPTSLLAMVDASVGGKAGVDFLGIKNQIGMFVPPQAVFIYQNFLTTLPERHLVNGLAEMFKHAVITDSAYWRDMKLTYSGIILPHLLEHLLPPIVRSVKIKNQIVLKDPLEQGLRQKLNFGHSVGHALEELSMQKDADPLLHGEAVAAGMVCEARISARLTGLQKRDLSDIADTLLSIFGKYDIRGQEDEILKLLAHDKKNRGGELRFTLLSQIGEAVYGISCSPQVVREALQWYSKL